MAGHSNSFVYRRGALHCEGVALSAVAGRVGTPVYVYSRAAIEAAVRRFQRALADVPHTLCYSVKANSNLAILRLLRRLGAGFDIVSGGELYRLRQARLGSAPMVFSGVGKTREEIDAAIKQGVLFLNVESAEELAAVAARAAHLRRRTRVTLRINPNVDPHTHRHIATGRREHKFGVPLAHAAPLSLRAGRERWLEWVGLGFHIGSQIQRLAPFRKALRQMETLAQALRSEGLSPKYLDVGGGVGIRYQSEPTFPFRDYARLIRQTAKKLGCHLILEPGRSLVAPAGVLLTRALYEKRGQKKRFLIVDAAMTDFLRPALYDAQHRIVPVQRNPRARRTTVDVVGPVCETADSFARDMRLAAVAPGELLAVCDTGAYGFVMASNYNSRPRPAEVLVSGKRMRVIRRRETERDLIRGETW